MATVQQHYFDVLMHRVRNDKYPSHQLMDRIEVALATSDQVAEYVDMGSARPKEEVKAK